MRFLLSSLLLVALAACATSEAKTYEDDVDVQIASVTLADNCGTPTPPPAPPNPPPPDQKFSQPPPKSDAPAPNARPARGSCAQPGSCGSPRRGCEATSMQLSLKARSSAQPTTIKIKRVELLDHNGRVLEVLTSSVPTQWNAKLGYVQWDQTMLGGNIVKASYTLTAPNWDKLTGGRMNAHSRTFQLRVTVTIGNADRTVEKRSITPARIAPMVVT
jgi:hypothetical protein